MRIQYTLPLMIAVLLGVLVLADAARCSAVNADLCSSYGSAHDYQLDRGS